MFHWIYIYILDDESFIVVNDLAYDTDVRVS